jgi:hypothetical protein
MGGTLQYGIRMTVFDSGGIYTGTGGIQEKSGKRETAHPSIKRYKKATHPWVRRELYS